MSIWQLVIVTTYVCLLAALSLVALHRLALAWRAGELFAGRGPMARGGRTGRGIAPASTPAPAPASGEAPPCRRDWPSVVVQVPLYNERFVAARVIEAVCRLDYPSDRLRVQVLDDSTDVTCELVAQSVADWRRQGVQIEHVRRGSREGFKAGALAHGLQRDASRLVAIFDADFVAPPDFLRRLVSEFDDPNVGMVQARWGHLDADRCLLTRAQAALLDGHFINEHAARFVGGHFFNFNGTCGIWRRAAIDDAGGWSHATLTEDLELSYRAQLRGWRFVYRPDVIVPGELPATARAFKSQQHRWAKGSIETARLVLPGLLRRRDLPWRTRVEATAHLVANAAYPLVLLLALLMPLVIVARDARWNALTLLLDLALLAGSSLSLVAFYAIAMRRSGHRDVRWFHLPVVLALGVGLAVNNTRALVEALARHRSAFERTPKLADADAGSRRRRAGVYAQPAGLQPWFELTFAALLAFAWVLAAMRGRWLALPFLAIFAGGFFWLSLGSLGWPLRGVRGAVVVGAGAGASLATVDAGSDPGRDRDLRAPNPRQHSASA